MKKSIIAAVITVIFSARAYAAQPYGEVLSERLRGEGIFNGGSGIIYADTLTFEEPSLLVISAERNAVVCGLYGDTDGLQLTDELSFSAAQYPQCRIGTVKSGGADYIILSQKDGVKEFFTVRNDAFTKTDLTAYAAETYAAGIENGKITAYAPKSGVYNTFNRLKAESANEYAMPNKIKLLPDEEADAIKTTVSACADIMRFDIKNYDYDRLFKYVLYTHENFRILTDIPPETGESATMGSGGVSFVSGEYIDYVMTRVFRITPEKPPVNSLISRGFCYNDGYYFYTGGFNVYFATEILSLTGAYDLGGNVVYVVFSDIYREGDNEIPEYSFAILQKTREGYSLLRLGMGESLPSQEEVRAYSPFYEYGGVSWKKSASPDEAGDDALNGIGNKLMPLLLAVCAVGTVGLVCAVVTLIRARR